MGRMLWIVVCLTLASAGAAASEPPDPTVKSIVPPTGTVTVAWVENYIKSFLAEANTPERDRRWKRAPELAAHIVTEALAAQVDPMVVTVIVRRESSFIEPRSDAKGLTGARGERGLGQLHGLAARRARVLGCDLETGRGQVCGVARWYAVCLEECSTESAALHAYQTGRCTSSASGPKLRAKELVKLRAALGIVED